MKVTIWGPSQGLGVPAPQGGRGAEASWGGDGDGAARVDGVLDGERRRARFVGANREVPAMTVAVGERAAIDTALAELDVPTPFVTVESVESFPSHGDGQSPRGDPGHARHLGDRGG